MWGRDSVCIVGRKRIHRTDNQRSTVPIGMPTRKPTVISIAFPEIGIVQQIRRSETAVSVGIVAVAVEAIRVEIAKTGVSVTGIASNSDTESKRRSRVVGSVAPTVAASFSMSLCNGAAAFDCAQDGNENDE